jgi:dTDP-4-dehydrorhamnose 3,5-epimerase-like enzyme
VPFSDFNKMEMHMVEYKVLNFVVHGNHQGSLVALEKGADFPFEIKRVYYIWNTDEKVVRGKHAHRKLEQVIVCTSGSCDFILDNGTEREIVHLDNPAQGLYIKNNIWREFTNFSKDCVVMVLASEHYTEEDYVRDYATFLKEVSE